MQLIAQRMLPQLGEPQRSSHDLPNVHDASLAERNTPVRLQSRMLLASGEAAACDYRRYNRPSP